MSEMFAECHKLKAIKGINNFNTNWTDNMSSMFEGCKELEYLDLSNFKTNHVYDMSKMFKKCYKLKGIEGIYNFIISENTKLDEMFDECNDLKNVNVSKFNNFNSKLILMVLDRNITKNK